VTDENHLFIRTTRYASCIAIFALHTQPADVIPRPFDRKILLPSLLP